ncbi:DUF3592 domain-containing protein [Patescibacteria group bacterium]|nr:DUF3592 domain-containing protein [Patescibacteria group bacterium]
MPGQKGEFLWIFFIPALVLLGLAIFFLVKNLRIMTSFEKTKGTITRYEISHTKQNQTLYQTIVTYKAADGAEREAGSLTRSSSAPGKIGDTITVYYNPAQPEVAHVQTFRDSWLHILLLGAIGFVLFVIWFGTWVGPPAAAAITKTPT